MVVCVSRALRTTPWPSCAPKPAGIRTTGWLSDLVGELSTQSETFRTRWVAHNVRIHQTGVERVQHPVVGDLSLTYEMMELAADTGLTI